MHLTFLSLTDFRSYKNAELVLRPGITTFIGSNGEGKTNFAEAIGYLAYLSSHRTGSDTPLIRLGCERAYIRAKVMNDDREELLEIEINNGRANRGRINQSPSRSTKELLGHLRAVLFTPEDLSLVKGDPSERRDYLDKILISRTPRLAGTITDYERVIKQRNSLLKTRPNERELVPWDGQLAKLASQVTAARLACNQMGINNQLFYEAIQSFTGAAKRLELVFKTETFNFYKDFAHSPSKLKATTDAVKQQFPERKIIACMELHTFSSLTEDFLNEYKNSMNLADEAIVYYNPHTISHKKLKEISPEQVHTCFNRKDLIVFTKSEELTNYIRTKNFNNSVLLMMSSGNFDGVDFTLLANELKY